MKNIKLIYWISIGLLSALMLMSAGMYFFNHEAVKVTFTNLSYPTYIIYPLAVVKILGIIAIWTKKSETLKEWAYAGFFFDVVLAASAHIVVEDGQAVPALIGLVLVLTSYISERRLASV